MLNTVTKTLPVIALAAACFAAPVQAQQRVGTLDTGFYVGAQIGASNTDVDTAGLASVGFATTGTDETDTAWNFVAGYKFTRNWAIEVGYIDLGSFSATGRFGGAPASISADVRGFNISAVGTLPLNDMFSLYGKLGYLRSETKASASVGGALASGKSRDNDFTMGIGARYHFNRNFSLTLEANHYELGDSGDAQAYLVGVRYDF